MTTTQTQTKPNVETSPKPVDVEPAVVQQWLKSGDTVLIDVREPFEHAAERIAGAVSVPLGTLDPEALCKRFPGKRIVFHCAGGKRSAKACERFTQGKTEPACHLAGGIEGWKRAQLPTQTPQQAGIPVMRQVQITAGSLVVLGIVLSLTVSPWLIGLSAFVGCGLIFAGTTGWCGMAKLLALMPWNRAMSKH